LDALVLQAEHDAQGLDQLGLGKAGNADQQRMTAGEQGDQGLIHPLPLAENDSADAIPDQAQALAERFDFGDEFVGRGREGLGTCQDIDSFKTGPTGIN
jgi:hypothetical protein